MILRLENREKTVELEKDESEVSKKVREIERKKRKKNESEKDDQTDREKRNIGAKSPSYEREDEVFQNIGYCSRNGQGQKFARENELNPYIKK